jgi:hypothetical protein
MLSLLILFLFLSMGLFVTEKNIVLMKQIIVEGLKDNDIQDNKGCVNRLICVFSLTHFHHQIVYVYKVFKR